MHCLTNVERNIGLFTGCILAFDAVLLLRTSARVDWLSYGLLFSASLVMLAIGCFLRLRRVSESWAMPLVGIALYGMFGVAIALFNYLLLPVGDRLIDPTLIATDASFGFVWPHYVESFLDFPVVGQALGHVYMSSLAQLLFVILVLGALQLRTKLNEFLLTGMIACSITVAIWFAMPSTGPSAHFILSADVTEKLGMVVDPQYGAKVKQIVVAGPELISPKTELGLVAFPSFHTVMALLAVWFLAGVRYLFVPAILLNIAMIPAILLHGGHYLTDVLGGAALFALSLLLAKWASARAGDDASVQASRAACARAS